MRLHIFIIVNEPKNHPFLINKKRPVKAGSCFHDSWISLHRDDFFSYNPNM